MREQLATHLRLTLAAVALLALSGCGSLDLITARNAMGDKDRFQWDSPRAVRYEAERLGLIEKGGVFNLSASGSVTTDIWNQTIEQLVLEWFPLGTPIDEITPYFEGKGFRHGLDTPDIKSYAQKLATSQGGHYYYFIHSYPIGLIGENILWIFFAFDKDHSKKTNHESDSAWGGKQRHLAATRAIKGGRYGRPFHFM